MHYKKNAVAQEEISESRATAEDALYDMMMTWDIEYIISILRDLAEGLPEEQKKFYLDEIKIWGAVGKKSPLVWDILNLIPAQDILSELDEAMAYTKPMLASKRRAQTRYLGPGDTGISPDVDVVRTPFGHPVPGIPTRLETDIRLPKSMKNYAEEDYWEKVERGEYDAVPQYDKPLDIEDFVRMPEGEDKETIRSELKSQIKQVFKYLPFPYHLMYARNWLAENNPKDLRDWFYERDQAGTIRRHQVYNFEAVDNQILDQMDDYDLYTHWYAIVKQHTIPGVNLQEVADAYSGLPIDYDKRYQLWLDHPNTDPENFNIEIPEQDVITEDYELDDEPYPWS